MENDEKKAYAFRQTNIVIIIIFTRKIIVEMKNFILFAISRSTDWGALKKKRLPRKVDPENEQLKSNISASFFNSPLTGELL